MGTMADDVGNVWMVGPANGQLNLTNGCNLACVH